MSDIVLSMTGIDKAFGGVKILKNVALDLKAGEVHALLGENGAGKSSLMKILMGVYQPDAGTYVVRGKPVRFASPAEAQRNGVSMVYQEFGLVRFLSVAENILLGRLPTLWGKVDWAAAHSHAAAILNRLGSRVSTRAIVGDLKVADQQEVEIARALSYDPAVFIMDEPTAALSRAEADNLAALIRVLRRNGVAIVYISHKLDEVFALADRVTILRDGSVAETCRIGEIDMARLVESMTGKAVDETLKRDDADLQDGGRLLDIKGLTAEGLFDDIDLSIAKGSVVGVAGLIGAGKSELARAIVGALPEGSRIRGRLIFEGHAIDVATMTPKKARRLGIGFVSEDRQAEGIVPEQSVAFNITLPALSRLSRATLLVGSRLRSAVAKTMSDVGLRPREPAKLVRFLSGGNQQKVVVGKWIAAGARLLILDEPTRGIDVGARQELYDVIRRQAKERGLGVLLLSSDMREILVASDQIVVMSQGRIRHRVQARDVTERDLLDLILPGGDEPAAVGRLH